MLSLTRKCDYALVAMAELAHCGRRTVSARDIATRIGVPLPVLTNVLHRLQRWGLVTSRQGARGGYSLSRSPERITLVDVIEAIEGTGRLTPCCCTDEDEAHATDCSLEADCRIRLPIRRVQEGLRQFLGSVTLFQLAFENGVVQLGLPDEADDGECCSAVGDMVSQGRLSEFRAGEQSGA
ncbi:MAG: RrF2 family transcriptional regulator [Planctomycetota bacterium]|jgi:Rrf2 family protein